jgi:hypothetical protein
MLVGLEEILATVEDENDITLNTAPSAPLLSDGFEFETSILKEPDTTRLPSLFNG